jgi:hypothetical protein
MGAVSILTVSARRMAREAASCVQPDSQQFNGKDAMDETEPIVAIGLLTQRDLDLLGTGFRRAFRVDETPCFDELLAAIDAAEQLKLDNPIRH